MLIRGFRQTHLIRLFGDRFSIRHNRVGLLDRYARVILFEILQANFKVQFSGTSDNVLSGLLDDALHHRIRFRQTLQTCSIQHYLIAQNTARQLGVNITTITNQLAKKLESWLFITQCSNKYHHVISIKIPDILQNALPVIGKDKNESLPSTNFGRSAGFFGSTATRTTGDTENFMTFMLCASLNVVMVPVLTKNWSTPTRPQILPTQRYHKITRRVQAITWFRCFFWFQISRPFLCLSLD